EGERDERASRRSPEADEALASRAETVTSDRITRDVKRRVDESARARSARDRVRDEAELGEEAFLDNDYLPGELEQPDERIAQVRSPRDEADLDAEAESATAREDRRELREERRERRERREARERADRTGGPQTVQPDDVRLDEEADRALEDAEEAAETDERSMDVERAELAEGEEAATTDDGRKDR
ncbi:MAG: polar amino acid ABC transporter permease, partial [Eggerthella lenta]